MANDNHHLVLGKLTDFLTGRILNETYDEQYRQIIARLLVQQKGYAKSDIIPGYEITAKTINKKGTAVIDFLVRLEYKNDKKNKKYCMLIIFGPGSIVTRHRSALAASRLVSSYQIPVVVVTNGVDADILDGCSGSIKAKNLDNLPSKNELSELLNNYEFDIISEKRIIMESRILYTYEIDGACNCDAEGCNDI